MLRRLSQTDLNMQITRGPTWPGPRSTQGKPLNVIKQFSLIKGTFEWAGPCRVQGASEGF